MTDSLLKEILAQLGSGDIVPYLGPGVLRGVVDRNTGKPIPADSDSLILAMTGGQPMSPRLMYEFPRAAMHLENKKGRSFIERFLTQVYGGDNWTLPGPPVAGQPRPALHHRLQPRHPAAALLYRCRAQTYPGGRRRAHRRNALPLRPVPVRGRQVPQGRAGRSRHRPAGAVQPLGTPLPKPGYVASDADFVDYITELMGGFAIPDWVKLCRKNKRYLFLGQHFNRDTERMVMSDLIYDAAEPAGWVLIDQPSDKERKVCERKNLQLIEADWSSLLALANPSATEVA
ncbi:SIR2 family protein [Azotobacter sp. CWF10]